MSVKKSYSSAFKAQVVIEILKEEKTLTQIASAYGIQPSLLRDWKALTLNALPATFEKRNNRPTPCVSHFSGAITHRPTTAVALSVTCPRHSAIQRRVITSRNRRRRAVNCSLYFCAFVLRFRTPWVIVEPVVCHTVEEEDMSASCA